MLSLFGSFRQEPQKHSCSSFSSLACTWAVARCGLGDVCLKLHLGKVSSRCPMHSQRLFEPLTASGNLHQAEDTDASTSETDRVVYPLAKCSQSCTGKKAKTAVCDNKAPRSIHMLAPTHLRHCCHFSRRKNRCCFFHLRIICAPPSRDQHVLELQF